MRISPQAVQNGAVGLPGFTGTWSTGTSIPRSVAQLTLEPRGRLSPAPGRQGWRGVLGPEAGLGLQPYLRVCLRQGPEAQLHA